MVDAFLSTREPRTWKVAGAPDGLEAIAWWSGNGDYRLEVALAPGMVGDAGLLGKGEAVRDTGPGGAVAYVQLRSDGTTGMSAVSTVSRCGRDSRSTKLRRCDAYSLQHVRREGGI